VRYISYFSGSRLWGGPPYDRSTFKFLSYASFAGLLEAGLIQGFALVSVSLVSVRMEVRKFGKTSALNTSRVLLQLQGECTEAHGSLCEAFRRVCSTFCDFLMEQLLFDNFRIGVSTNPTPVGCRDMEWHAARMLFLRPLLEVDDETSSSAPPLTSIEFVGVQHQIVSKGACRMYAVGPRRVSCLCVNALPIGVLVCQHGRDVPPQVAVAQLEAVCDQLRR
jgi:hypothetical protein